MKVLEFLSANPISAVAEHGVNFVREGDLACLTYGLVEAKASNDIANECRGLILRETDAGWVVVARSFDRFFNYGENGTTIYKGMQLEWFTKLDGSLIKIYHDGKTWRIGTKQTIDAYYLSEFSRKDAARYDGKKLVRDALMLEDDDAFQAYFDKASRGFRDMTFSFELTSPYNRVITLYHETRLRLLAVRHHNGEYLDRREWAGYFDILEGEWGTPEEFMVRADALTDFQEGFVGYHNGAPVIKLKSRKYVAAHHVRSSLNLDKNLTILVLTGEKNEFVAYFPEYTDRANELQALFEAGLKSVQEAYDKITGIENQKEFALEAMKHPQGKLMFQARKYKTGIEEAFYSLSKNGQLDYAMAFCGL